MTRIEVRSVGCTREGREIFSGVDLVATSGTAVAIVGPSGSGKSSLLAMIGGLARPSSGQILVDGSAGGNAQRSFGLILQGYALVSVLTARENVEAALRAAGHSPRSVAGPAFAALCAVGLESHVDHLVDQLSGGQQQRVAIARALARAPAVVLADEPTAEQDPVSRATVEGLLFAVASGGGIVLIATHDPTLAARCDVVVDLAATTA